MPRHLVLCSLIAALNSVALNSKLATVRFAKPSASMNSSNNLLRYLRLYSIGIRGSVRLVHFVLISASIITLPTKSYTQCNGRNDAAATSVPPAKVRYAAEQITQEQLKAYLHFIASDELEGRDTPSRGLDLAAKFIATNLMRWGVKPVGHNSNFFQRYGLHRVKIDPVETQAYLNDRKFTFGDDFLARYNPGTANGRLVYVGHGWVIKSKKLNAYAGVDVRDKIMIVAGEGLPKGVVDADLQGIRGEDYESPEDYGARNGAKGIIQIPNYQSLAFWDRIRHYALVRGVLTVDEFQKQEKARLPVITPSVGMLATLLRGEKLGAEEFFRRAVAGDAGAAFDLSPDKQLTFRVVLSSDSVSTQNVIGIIEGCDPVLKSEYVVIGAHYDHLGIGTSPADDIIFNGADDNGTGIVAVLSLAEVFAKGPRPKRSLLFIWHSGEEKGLWGSRYFVEHPPVPLSQITVMLNIDMIGRSRKEGDTEAQNNELTGSNEIYVIGSKMLSTELGLLSEQVNKSYLNLRFNYRYDDPKDPNRFFYRSDHFNYAREGIPIIFYFNGVHEDYHRSSDSPDKIDYLKLEKVTRTIYMTAWLLANIPARPHIDGQSTLKSLSN